MYATSFIALDGNDRLTGALTAQTAPYDRYRCHLCGSAMRFHPEYATRRPWCEHQAHTLTRQGRDCPYVKPGQRELRRVTMLRRHLPDARPTVRKTDWRCAGCDRVYHGERYCLICQTGEYSHHTCQREAVQCEC